MKKSIMYLMSLLLTFSLSVGFASNVPITKVAEKEMTIENIDCDFVIEVVCSTAPELMFTSDSNYEIIITGDSLIAVDLQSVLINDCGLHNVVYKYRDLPIDKDNPITILVNYKKENDSGDAIYKDSNWIDRYSMIDKKWIY